MQKSIFEKDYRAYLVCFFIIAALPFVNFQPWLSPPAWGKAIIFRIIIFFFIYLFLYRVITEKKYSLFKEIIKNKIIALLLILLLFYALATIFSLNPHFSFWGSPLRSGGSLNYILLIIFAILAFLIIKKRDWHKLWDFSFLIGLLVTLVAVAQKLNVFNGFIIPRSDRAIGTMGGAPFLALYLCLLIFMAFSFGINATGKKKWLYFTSSIFFIFGVVLSGSRGAILAIFAGFFFYVLFYPSKTCLPAGRRLKWLKIGSLGFLVLIILGLWLLNGHAAVIEKIEQNRLAGNAFSRVWSSVEPIFAIKNASLYDISSAVFRDRTASWIVSAEALREKPLLGFGPENFSIAFDKYYDMSLPGFQEGNEWWDRAHNFIFDISITAGIPTLIVFLLLIAFLFFKLQKDKNILKHGLQATFIVYLINNLFNFDVFSTFLLFFFAVAYALHLTTARPNLETASFEKSDNPFRTIAFIIAFIILLFFIWFGALKPLWINKEINMATNYLSQGKKDLALQKIESIISQKSNIRNYMLLQYVEILNISMSTPPDPTPETRLRLTQKAANALKESITLRPYYTRSWWALNIYSNYFLGILKNPSENIKKEAVMFCQKARELSPEHWKIIKDCATTYLILEDYETAAKTAQDCIDVKPSEGICWGKKAMAYIGLENIEEYDQLISLHKELISPYIKDNPRLINSLAILYRETGQYEKAREQAEIFLKLVPEQKERVEEFLKNLPK